ncbi:MAG: hypothetical protein ACREVM_03705, partial [Burkholderiales bacterium]
GIEELPVYYVDLDDPSEKQLNLALNRIHGEWDEEMLAIIKKRRFLDRHVAVLQAPRLRAAAA